jgi:hypothetical protein
MIEFTIRENGLKIKKTGMNICKTLQTTLDICRQTTIIGESASKMLTDCPRRRVYSRFHM